MGDLLMVYVIGAAALGHFLVLYDTRGWEMGGHSTH
jgi:hypothetical protein